MTQLLEKSVTVQNVNTTNFIASSNVPGYMCGEVIDCGSREEAVQALKDMLESILSNEYAEETVQIFGSAEDGYISVVSDGEHDLGWVLEFTEE